MTHHEAENTTNDPASAVLERARHFVDDLTLTEVVRWKKDHPGRLAVGYMPIYVPRPMLEGIGCLPVAMFGGGDQVDIIKGDSFYQSYICHIPRSTLELALNGSLDSLDGVLFPSICDVIRNLSGMWQMLFPEKYASYVDLPQNFDPELGGKFYVNDMARILRDLTARGAWKYDADKMRTAIAAENSRRAALKELDTLRVKEPFRVRASEAYLVARAGGLLEAAAHETLVREFVAAAKQRAHGRIAVLAAGMSQQQLFGRAVIAAHAVGHGLGIGIVEQRLLGVAGWIERVGGRRAGHRRAQVEVGRNHQWRLGADGELVGRLFLQARHVADGAAP